MRFIIKPNDDESMDLMIESRIYNDIWNQHARKIRKAFRDVTGLDFQQRVITARVFRGGQSVAGRPHEPMKLAADFRSAEFKLITIVHELSHRLLGGNALGPVSLGLWGLDDEDGLHTLWDHRHTYLFEYDVVNHALGEQWAQVCRQYEERESGEKNDPHERAWKWAMKMSFEQRQKALKRLTIHAITRENWVEYEVDEIPRINPGTWFRNLTKH